MNTHEATITRLERQLEDARRERDALRDALKFVEMIVDSARQVDGSIDKDNADRLKRMVEGWISHV